MGTNPETILTRKIVSALTAAGCWCIKIHGSQYQMAGIPDLMVMRAGTVGFIEVKTPAGSTSKVQDAVMAKIAKHGVPVCVARSPGEAVEFVERSFT